MGMRLDDWPVVGKDRHDQRWPLQKHPAPRTGPHSGLVSELHIICLAELSIGQCSPFALRPRIYIVPITAIWAWNPGRFTGGPELLGRHAQALRDILCWLGPNQLVQFGASDACHEHAVPLESDWYGHTHQDEGPLDGLSAISTQESNVPIEIDRGKKTARRRLVVTPEMMDISWSVYENLNATYAPSSLGVEIYRAMAWGCHLLDLRATGESHFLVLGHSADQDD